MPTPFYPIRICFHQVLKKAKELHQVTFIWVKGHDGHAQNERCDTLATSAADGNDLQDDVILE